MFGWIIARIEGNSMAPTLTDGDYVFARHGPVAIGSVALIRHPSLGLLVKRLQGRDEYGHYHVSGDNPASASSDALGMLAPNAIEAIVRWRLSPHGLRKLYRRNSVTPYFPLHSIFR